MPVDSQNNAVLSQAKDIALKLYRSSTSLVDFHKCFFATKDDVPSAWFHHEWSRMLLTGESNAAVQGFRECGKSSYVIRMHTLHRLVYPTEEYDFIVFILANQRLASAKLEEIANEYLSHPDLCGNLVKILKQNDRIFHVVVRDVNGDARDVRIEAYGKGAALRGLVYRDRRPKLVVIDDPQDDEDAHSESVLDKDWDWFLSDVNFLGKNTRIFIIGNNLGERCLIERIHTHSEELDFKVWRIPKLNEEDESNWPQRWTPEEIFKERENFSRMGKLDIWYREMMCQPISPATQRFTRDMFRYYEPHEIDRGQLAVYTTVDLAISQKESADYTCVMTIGVNKENHWFLLDCQYGRWNPTETMGMIFSAVSRWHPITVGIETVQYQAALVHFLEREMIRRNQTFMVTPLKASKKKELRIEMMQPRFATGSVWFPEHGQFVSELEAELLAFTLAGTRGAHDDLIDALAYMEQIAQPPSGWFCMEEEEEIPLAGAM